VAEDGVDNRLFCFFTHENTYNGKPND
jgi:hypothetical protein